MGAEEVDPAEEMEMWERICFDYCTSGGCCDDVLEAICEEYCEELEEE